MEKKQIKIFGKDISVFIYDIVKVVVLIAFVILCAYPFYYVIIYSFSDAAKASALGVYLLPRQFTLNNYRDVFELGGIWRSFFISVSRTVLGTLISVVCTSLLAYLMTKDMWGRKIVYRFVIITMYVSGGLIPWYIVMSTYGFTNNFLAYIVPSAISAYNMILIKTFMEQLPSSMEESAAIEGSSMMNTFFKIILPLSKPIIATVSVYCVVGQWNSWQDNFFLNKNKNLQTMQLLLRNMLNQAQELAKAAADADIASGTVQTNITPEAIQMTSVVVTMVPVMLAYPFAQKYFTKGLMMGAVKG